MARVIAGAGVEFAPAKVNLTLHVTGRRADGYHLLDSLVVFPRIGDRLSATAAQDLTLDLAGPFAGSLSACDDNLVLRAARLLARAEGQGAALRLEKILPVASGIGGGSSDAAACLRLLSRLWGVELPPPEACLALGADVPVCLAARPTRMTGVGEGLVPVDVPPCWVVLCNPGVPVATAGIFRRLERADNAPMPGPPPMPDAAALAAFLRAQRNDLEAPARAVAPVIGEVITALDSSPGCLLARMSGSGATCFGLFAGEDTARAGAARIAAASPGWWVQAAMAGGPAGLEAGPA